MKDRWLSLSLQEKRMVTGGTMAAILLIGYMLFWSPLTNKVQSLRADLQQNNALLRWMTDTDKRIQSLEQHLQPATKTNTKSIFSTVQTAIDQSPFAKKLTGLRQAELGQVQINLKEVSFDDLTKWLIQRWQQQGLQVTQMTITRASEPGIVTVEFILKG